MTTRTVFIPSEHKPYYRKVPVEFEFHPGQSALQKMKNVKALQDTWSLDHPDARLLEVSTKSPEDTGRRLSPFNLTRTLYSLNKEFPVENIVQASKVLEQGGPYYDLLGTDPLSAKQDPRTTGKLEAYSLEGELYPASPDFLFYTWIYAMAVLENNLQRVLLDADAFSDIEFAGSDGNCQARACAITKSLLTQSRLKKNMTFEEFSRLFLVSDLDEVKLTPKKDFHVGPNPKKTVFSVGDWLIHPAIGQGQVMKKTPRDYTIMFRVSGPRTLRKDVVETKCSRL